MYAMAWDKSNHSRFEAFWQSCRIAAVAGVLGGGYPTRQFVSTELWREVALNKSTHIPQLVAFLHLNSTDFRMAANSWSAAFHHERPPTEKCPNHAFDPASPMPGVSHRTHIAYMSAHFRDHPAGHHLPGALPFHDRKRFLISCFATSGDDGSIHRKRAQSACDQWVSLPPSSSPFLLSSLLLASSPPIDAIVYIDGYDRGHSIPSIIAARMCAAAKGLTFPFVISFFGFLGTLGGPNVIADAIITDEVASPPNWQVETPCLPHSGAACTRTHLHPEVAEPFILRHPGTFFLTNYWQAHPELGYAHSDCRDSLDLRKSTGGVSAIQHDGSPSPLPDMVAHTNFCCFNQLFRVTPEVLLAWARILIRTGLPDLDNCALPVAGPTLVLMEYPPLAPIGLLDSITALAPVLQQVWADRLEEVSVGRGQVQCGTKQVSGAQVAAALHSRIKFQPIMSYEEHLPWKRRTCSLGLDTPRYNGHTSVTDLLWAGVPVLTWAEPESGMAGRAAASAMRAAGAPSWFIADSRQSYEDKAVQYAETQRQPWLADPESDAMQWRPSPCAPLFRTVMWVSQFEELIDEALHAFRN